MDQGRRVEEQAATPPPARPLPSLRSNFTWTLAGNFVYAGCQWGMLVALARLGDAETGPVMVGQFALGLALTAPVIMFSNLQLRNVQVTDARHEYSFSDYLALRLVMTAAALVVIAGLAFLLGSASETALVILAIGLSKAVEAVSDVYHGLLQKHERMDRIAVSLMLKGVLALAALAVTVFFLQSVFWGSVALAASALVILLAYDLPSAAALQRQLRTWDGPGGDGRHPADRLAPRWQLHALLKLARLALPLGLVMFIISLTANVPRYFVEHQLGLYQLGIFAPIVSLMVVGSTVVSALGASASPRLARYYAAGDVAAFGALLVRLLALGTCLGGLGILVGVLAGREVLSLCFGPEYGVHADVLAWVMVAAGVGYVESFLGYAMTAARYFRVQVPLFVVVVLVTAGACAWLVPSHQLVGAAWAMGLGGLVKLLGSAAVVRHALSSTEKRCP
jgi:O-antigen/teichoic acid export membrane protein